MTPIDSPGPTPPASTPAQAPSAAPAAPSSQSSASAPPSPAPASPVAAAADADQPMDWGTLDNDFEPADPAAAPQPVDPAVDPSAAAAADATAAQPPLDPAAAPQPPVEPDASKASTKSPAEVALEEVNSPEFQAKVLTQLEQGYQLTEEERNAFLDDPAKAIPGLAAKMHLRMAYQMTQMVSTMMEQMLVPVIDQRFGHHSQRGEALRQANEVIFKPYPELRKASDEAIRIAVQTVSKAAPGIKGKQALDRVAAAVYAMYGWQLPSAGGGQPAAPARSLPPHQPAAAGSSPPPLPLANGKQVDANGIDWGQFDG